MHATMKEGRGNGVRMQHRVDNIKGREASFVDSRGRNAFDAYRRGSVPVGGT